MAVHHITLDGPCTIETYRGRIILTVHPTKEAAIQHADTSELQGLRSAAYIGFMPRTIVTVARIYESPQPEDP